MNGVDNGFGSRLRYVRERWHLTPEDLSERTGVDTVTIRQVEAGGVDPGASTTQRLAESYACTHNGYETRISRWFPCHV